MHFGVGLLGDFMEVEGSGLLSRPAATSEAIVLRLLQLRDHRNLRLLILAKDHEVASLIRNRCLLVLFDC